MRIKFSQDKMINKKINKNVRILLVGIIIGLFLIGSVSAYQKLCLSYGQSVPNEENPRYTCWHDFCDICVTNDFYPSHPGNCKSITGCSTIGNTTNMDTQPPQLTIYSPIDGEVYSSRKVLFDIRSDEPASLYYIDNINGRGQWKRLYSYTQSLTKGVSFKDGLNDVTIRGIDKNGNEAEVVRSFYVDSKNPKIKKTYPKSGFASGLFEVEFQEENPAELILHYGNHDNMEFEELNINECEIVKGKYYCSVEVDLNSYDGEIIEYWFELRDIAGNVDENKPVSLEVDIGAPVLINNGRLNEVGGFASQGVEKYNKYIYFSLEIGEPNFDEVSYIDWNDKKPKWKRLCSRLKDGKCETKKSFRKGEHVVDVQISDEAGNVISAGRLEFEVN